MITHPVLTRLAGSGVRLGLERTEAFLHHLGDPHLAVPVVHVAGTNGKGSVCWMVAEAAAAAGYRVALHTSPHLEHVNERFRIGGVPLSDPELDALLVRVDGARAAWARDQGLPDDVLTYFELVTVAAFVAFAERGCDLAVVEVGLGGRLDATNVVHPQVCAITSIGLDHADRLGPTHAHIAREKAGILEPGVPAVVGPVPSAAAEAIAQVAADVGAPCWWAGRELHAEGPSTSARFRTPAGALGPVALGMAGQHQVDNALVAVGVLHQLRARGWSLPDDALVRGLTHARVPGRLERLAEDVVVDGAHNPEGAAALAAWLAQAPRRGRRVLLFGMGEDRDPVAVAGPLLPHVDAVITTRCAHPAARDPEALAAALGPLVVEVRSGGDVESALPLARAGADEVVVAGSLYVVGAVRALVAAERGLEGAL